MVFGKECGSDLRSVLARFAQLSKVLPEGHCYGNEIRMELMIVCGKSLVSNRDRKVAFLMVFLRFDVPGVLQRA